MADFASMVSAWCREAPERLDAAYARSVELLADEMTKTTGNGGRLPFRTGNLMRSMLASTAGPPMKGAENQKYSGSDVGLVTATLRLGVPIWLGFQANYAHRMNFGFVGPDSLGRVYNQAGYHFVENAVAQWPALVAKAAKEIESG
jgi:hypothetical protein